MGVDFMVRVVTIQMKEVRQWNVVRPLERCENYDEMFRYKVWKDTFYQIPYVLRRSFYMFFHVEGSGSRGAKQIFDLIDAFYL